MSVTLGEEVMLLSLDDESGVAQDRAAAGWAVASGILLDLALMGRLSVSEERLDITDPTPTGVALLDTRLEQLVPWAEGRAKRAVGDWLTRDQGKAVPAAIDSLSARGLIAEERRRVLGLFPVRRYPEADGATERELRARLASVVLEGAVPDDRTTGLIALLHAANLHRLAFPDEPRARIKDRMAEISEGQWAGDTVRAAITAMQVTLATTIATTMIVTTASTGT